MKFNKIALAAIAVIVLAVVYMWWSSKNKGPAADVTIVTPMPVSGYSIANDGFANNGIAEGLPETLSPVEPALAVQATEIPTMKPDVISAISTAAAMPSTDPSFPIVDSVKEGYASYAPAKWRGNIL